MTRIGSGGPPPSLPSVPTEAPKTAQVNQPTIAAQRKEIDRRDDLRRGGHGAAHAPAQSTEPKATPAELTTLLTELKAINLGDRPTIPGAESLRLTVPEPKAEELLAMPFDPSEVTTLDQLARALAGNKALAGLQGALADLSSAADATFFTAGEAMADPKGIGKALAAELKKLLPRDLKKSELREMARALHEAAGQRLTPEAMKAMQAVFGKLPPSVMHALARLSPQTLYMLGALVKRSPERAQTQGQGARQTSEASASQRQDGAQAAGEPSDDDLLALMQQVQPIVLARKHRDRKGAPIDGLVGTALAAGEGMDVEQLVMIVLAQIRADNQTDVKETLAKMESIRIKKQRAKDAKRALEQAQSEAEVGLRARYKDRTTPGHPEFIDPEEVSFEEFAAEQALLDGSEPPLSGPPSDLELGDRDPSFEFAVAPEDAEFPGFGDDEDGSIGGAGDPEAPGGPEDPGAPPDPNAPGGPELSREQQAANDYGISMNVLSELEDFMRAVGITGDDLITSFDLTPPFGPGLVKGATDNKARIRAWVQSFTLTPSRAIRTTEGPTVGNILDGIDVDDEKYQEWQSGKGIDRYKEAATQEAKKLTDWAAAAGLQTGDLDALLKTWFVQVWTKSRSGGDDPKDAKWFEPIQAFLLAIPIEQRDEYLRYVELRTAEFHRDVEYALNCQALNYDSKNGRVAPDGAYYGVFLGDRKNDLKREGSEAGYTEQLGDCKRALNSFLKVSNPLDVLVENSDAFKCIGTWLMKNPDLAALLPPDLRELLPAGGSQQERLEILQALARADKLDDVVHALIPSVPDMNFNTTTTGGNAGGPFGSSGTQPTSFEDLQDMAASMFPFNVAQALQNLPTAAFESILHVTLDELRQTKMSKELFDEAIAEKNELLDALDEGNGINGGINGRIGGKGYTDRFTVTGRASQRMGSSDGGPVSGGRAKRGRRYGGKRGTGAGGVQSEAGKKNLKDWDDKIAGRGGRGGGKNQWWDDKITGRGQRGGPANGNATGVGYEELPSTPAGSNEPDDVPPASPPREPEPLSPGRRLRLDDIKLAIDAWQDAIDSQSEAGEEVQLRLQILMDRFTQSATMLSNIMKKISDTTGGIIQNTRS